MIWLLSSTQCQHLTVKRYWTERTHRCICFEFKILNMFKYNAKNISYWITLFVIWLLYMYIVLYMSFITHVILCVWGRRGRDRMVVGFKTTYAISGSAYHHWCCEFESRSGWGVQHYMIKFVSNLRQVGGFLRVLRFPPPIKLTTTI